MTVRIPLPHPLLAPQQTKQAITHIKQEKVLKSSSAWMSTNSSLTKMKKIEFPVRSVIKNYLKRHIQPAQLHQIHSVSKGNRVYFILIASV